MTSMQTAYVPRGPIREHVSMAALTAWGVGGLARRVFEPEDRDDLVGFIRAHREEPLLFVGLGSNLLVRDGGFVGTVVLMTKGFKGMAVDGDSVVLDAGTPCPKAARFCAANGLAGLEFFAGIPGTVGGALAMNAGAYGSETWDRVHSVDVLGRDGVIATRAPGAFGVSYRTVTGTEDLWFLSARFDLEFGNSDELQTSIRELLRKRVEEQPTGQRSCGSVFRNPMGDYAGRLIEHCGLKGTRVGHAAVSAKHANFIINDGGASAGDIESLIALVTDQVEAKTGVRLVPEVRIVGTARESSS
ncbi:MAG: UDP-N-acetylmuramate dehydrogenase [Pseudomonadota bacterium]